VAIKYLYNISQCGDGRYKVCIVARTKKRLLELLSIIMYNKENGCVAIKYSNDPRCGYVGFAYFNNMEKALHIRRLFYKVDDMYVFIQDDKKVFPSSYYRGR